MNRLHDSNGINKDVMRVLVSHANSHGARFIEIECTPMEAGSWRMYAECTEDLWREAGIVVRVVECCSLPPGQYRFMYT